MGTASFGVRKSLKIYINSKKFFKFCT